jgi:hypothetical protein
MGCIWGSSLVHKQGSHIDFFLLSFDHLIGTRINLMLGEASGRCSTSECGRFIVPKFTSKFTPYERSSKLVKTLKSWFHNWVLELYVSPLELIQMRMKELYVQLARLVKLGLSWQLTKAILGGREIEGKMSNCWSMVHVELAVTAYLLSKRKTQTIQEDIFRLRWEHTKSDRKT